jgi:ubiquinone/menaquinone biosynthesis C-methylase UbiE
MNNSYCDFAEFYDVLMSDVDYVELAHYYNSIIKSFTQINTELSTEPEILLDLACGTGTLSVLMAEQGWDVIAVDSSPEMLSRAKPHERCSYICQDMTELDLYGTIHAAVCTLDGLNHLEGEEEVFETLKRVSLFMEEGGVFAFDLNTIYKHETILSNHIFVKEFEQVFCVWENEYQGDGVVDINLNIFSKYDNLYNRFEVELREKAYDLSVIKSMCERVGFTVTEQYDFLTTNKVTNNSKFGKVVFICRKKAV